MLIHVEISRLYWLSSCRGWHEEELTWKLVDTFEGQ
jgi:hypothetical protein